MCSGSKTKIFHSGQSMDKGTCFGKCSVLLELSASDDLVHFRDEVEERGLDVNEVGYWYGRRIGPKKMCFEERTPLMIAAIFGSTNVLKYIIDNGKVDINRACGKDNVTALHCAVAGGANSSVVIIKLLLDASANVHIVDANGNKALDLFAPSTKSPLYPKRKLIELLLKGESLSIDEDEKMMATPRVAKEVTEKREFPIDISLPHISDGIYGSDEFRMYSFKVRPCSRAYSHDWTECPFVHPAENARRRDPRKYSYSCVPCPEFRKGMCHKGDACEYAHGVFESWLHPAQYRTRLCKGGIGCPRKVCFFAHKPEELRPVYASTVSALPSPTSLSVSSLDVTTLSPLTIGLPSPSMPTTSTPPMSPLAAVSSLPKSGSLWQNRVNLTPPALQLLGSRLNSALCARDLNLEMEFLGLDNQVSQLQQLQEGISSLSSPSHWSDDFSRIGDLNATNLDDVFGSLDPSLMSPLHRIPLKPSTPTKLQSPTALQMRQNMSQLRASYPANLSSSLVRKSSPFGFDSSAAVAAAVMNSRSSAFGKRSQSFIDRGAATNRLGLPADANSLSMTSTNLSDWSSADGKLDWGMQVDELNKLKKSASFGFRNHNAPAAAPEVLASAYINELDVSWVNSLVKDVPPAESWPANVER